MGLYSFYRISKPSQEKVPAGKVPEVYKRLRRNTFWAATVAYSLYYVCRLSLSVVKQPLIDSELLTAGQLGIIGSAMLFVYAVGKFMNGFIADYCNIRRFMATGLAVSALINLLMGVLGFLHGDMGIASVAVFISFVILWGINGWAQSMGSPPGIINLSRWFPLNKRGTYYGIFSATPYLGEFLSFIVIGAIVGTFGWQSGFIFAAAAGVIGTLAILFFVSDTPESKGLPSVQELSSEELRKEDRMKTSEVQKSVLKHPGIWIISAASAFIYITKYAVAGWGVLFLQEAKGFSDVEAISIVSINALLGIFGTVLSGWFSDKLFKGDRKIPALLFGILNSVALGIFLYGGDALWVNVLAMILFGIAIGVLICFLGGLMAVDIVPRKATGAALGVVGIASYIAAGIQDVASGWLIDAHISLATDGSPLYDFRPVSVFWIAASIISFLLPLLNRKTRKTN